MNESTRSGAKPAIMRMRRHAVALAATLAAALAFAAPTGAWAVDGDVADQAAAAAKSSHTTITPGQSITLAEGTYWTSLTGDSGITPGQYRVKLDGTEGTQVASVKHLDSAQSGKDTSRELVAGEAVTIDVDADTKVTLTYPASTTWTLVKAYDNYALLDAGALVPRAGAKTYRVGNSGILPGTYAIAADDAAGTRAVADQHVTILDVDERVISETTVGGGTQVVEVPDDATYIRLDTTTPTLWRKLEQRPAWKRVKDVTDATAHHEEIMDLMKANISTGWEQTDGSVVYAGMKPVVRQDMAAFLYRLAGSPDFDVASFRNPFVDVDEDTPHYKEILWLYANDISTGYKDADGNLTFAGMKPVVRQDMAAFLHRYVDWVQEDGDEADETGSEGDDADSSSKSFTDVSATTPHADDIDWLSRSGIASGYADGSFGGTRVVVRQDMAAFLIRTRAFAN